MPISHTYFLWSAQYFALPFLSHTYEKMFITYSESSLLWQCWFWLSEPIYPERSNHCLKHLKPQNQSERFLTIFGTKDLLGVCFCVFEQRLLSSGKAYCREPKLVWLEPSGHEGSENVNKISGLFLNKTAMETFSLHQNPAAMGPIRVG
jgi:hypothetical protein